jgi:hypothetical protein
MAVANFPGSAGVHIDLEPLDHTGAVMQACVAKRSSDGTWDALVTGQTAADAFRYSLAISSGNRLQFATHNGTNAFAADSSAGASPFTVLVADLWCQLVAIKPAGASDVTLGKYGPKQAHTGMTGVASTDVLTVTGHTLTDGQLVTLSALTGGNGLSTGTYYWVRDVAGNTFKLAATVGGAAVNFTTNVTAGTVNTLQWTWTTPASDPLSNAATIAGGKTRLGRYEATDELAGRIAAYAPWNSAPSTATAEGLAGGTAVTWLALAGGAVDLVEPGMVGASARANWSAALTSRNGLLDGTAFAGAGTIVTTDDPPAEVYTVGVVGGTSETVTAVPMDGTGDLVAAAVDAAGQVVGVPLDGTGDLVAAGAEAGSTVAAPVIGGSGDLVASAPMSVEIGAPAMAASGDLVASAFPGGDSTVVGVPLDGAADLVAAGAEAGSDLPAVPLDGTGDLVAAGVAADGNATVQAVPLDATADMPGGQVSPETPGQGGGLTLLGAG